MGDFNSKYSGAEVEGLLDKIANIGDTPYPSSTYFLSFTINDLYAALDTGGSVVLESPAAFVDAITSGSRICIFGSDPPAEYIDVVVLYFKFNDQTGIIKCDIMVNIPGSTESIVVSWTFKQTDDSTESVSIFPLSEQLYRTAEITPSDGSPIIYISPYVVYYIVGPITSLTFHGVDERFNIGVNYASILFETGDDFSLISPDYFMWPNGTVPIFEPNTSYELSLATSPYYDGMRGGVSAILVPLKYPEE